jgi:DNA mismatch repair protein MutS
MGKELTPMMRQYLNIKDKHKDAILFFRLGDFYEMFFDDAVIATKILHITLTSRGTTKGNKVPMCGIPYHAANNYIARLIKNGKKVAICEQIEDPDPGKKIVNREVIQIITPGTFMADEILDESINNYILSFHEENGVFGLAYADLSTGEFRVTQIDNKEQLFSELYKISPSESLVPEYFSKTSMFNEFREVALGAVTVNEDWYFDRDFSRKQIMEHFSVKTLEGFGCEKMDVAVGSAGALLRYLKHTQKTALNNLDVISSYNADQYMVLDRNTQRHLELVQNQEDFSSKATLFDVLDRTKTPMGKRKLKRWILNPLMDTASIRKRLDAVSFFYENPSVRETVRDLLSGIYDVERLANKTSLGTANPKDMTALSLSLKGITELKKAVKGNLPLRLSDILKKMDPFDDIIAAIDERIVENPPTSVKEGGIIKSGFSGEVDELNDLVRGGKDWLTALQKREIKRTGISSLKVGYNKIFGYYIEVTRANLSSVPSDYIRKQTLVNAERFITEELKSQESRIIGAQERIKDLEYEIFRDLTIGTGKQIERLKKTADLIAQLDVLSDFAEIAVINRYTRPLIAEKKKIEITEARHPVLENILKEKEFVPNNIKMDADDNRIFVITGSNMAGKSTFIRQTALINIMAQIGSFIPAAQGEISIVDRIFTRVGASDRLYSGMSTFMVEMLETANILNNATGNSLIILDEVGRGTSTYDGVSIAWAVVEYIYKELEGAKALFATHYHELTELSSILKGIKNYHLAVQEYNDQIIFLYKVKEGSCDESFGIHVAKLAGMPQAVIKRAHNILENLHRDSFMGNIKTRFAEKDKKTKDQLDFFTMPLAESEIEKKLKTIDINALTPLEALKKLAELKGLEI